MRIDELIQTLVVNTDFAPVSPPALGPGYKATLAQIVSAGLYQPNSSTAGAGANLTIKAADGVTSGAGGSIVLQPGAQATTGGNGVVVIRQPGGTAGTNECQIFNTGLDTYFRTGTNANGGFFYFQRGDGQTMFYTTAGQGGQSRGIVCDNFQPASYSVTIGDQSNGVNLASGKILGFRNTGYAWTEGYTAGLGFATPGVIQVGRYNSSVSLTNGGSFAYPASTPTAISANTDNLVLTGSAFQRLSSSAAYNLTGIAPPSGGAHVDGRVIWLHNVGSFNITLKHSATSTAANQFITETSGDLVLGPNRIVQCTYDGTSAKWRAHGETYPYVFPTADGTNGQVLVTNGSGTLSWSTNGNASASGTTNYVAKFTGTTSLGDGIIFDNGTHVGIGTTTLNQIGGSRTLSINSNLDAGIELNANNTVYGVVYANTNGLGLSGFGAFGMRFYTASAIAGSAERMRIDASGRVGIGTTAPIEKLDVRSSSAFNAASANIAFFGSNEALASNPIGLAIQHAYSGARAFVSLVGTRYGLSGNDIEINGDSSGVGKALTVQYQGNVGIGTAAPGAKLQVDTLAAATKGLIVRGFTSQSANLQEWQNSAGTALGYINSDMSLLVTPATFTLGSQSNNSGVVELYSGTVRLRPSSLGNYILTLTQRGVDVTGGVGDTTPVLKVTRNADANVGPVAQFVTGSTTHKGITVVGVASQTGNLQEWQNSSGTALAQIDAAGSATVVSLDISGPANLQMIRTKPNSVSYSRFLYSGSNENILYGGPTGLGVNNFADSVRLFNIADTGATSIALTSAAAKGLIVKGFTSQSANLQEWQNSSGTALATVSAAGTMILNPTRSTNPYFQIFPSGDSYNVFKIYSPSASWTGAGSSVVYEMPDSNNTITTSWAGTMTMSSTVPIVLKANNIYSNNPYVAVFATNTEVARFTQTGLLGVGTTSPGAMIQATTTAAATKGLIVRGFTSQSANLQEWQDSSSNILGYVSPTGSISSKFFEVKNQYVGQSGQPTITFTGAGNVPIALKVLDDSYGTLSFEGSAGQLFSINNNLASGIIFSVNDISGIPQIDVNADGTIRLAPFAGNIVVAGMTVGMGGGNVSTNTAFGYNALNVNTTGGANTAIGYQALVANTGAGADNTAIGYRALYSNTTGYDNTAVGLSALNLNTTGIDNTAVGVFALRANTASGNSAFGRNALQSNTSGNLNAAFGYYALNANTTGASNTAVGYEAAAQLTTASDTVAIGYRALKNPSTGATSSTAVGSYALAAVTTATDNTAVGRYAGYQLTTGGANSILGAAMYTATTAYYNVAIGHMSLHTLLTGQRNVSVGYQAGYSVTGSYNAIFGAEGGSSVTNGSYNTVVGALALPGANGSNNTVIGSFAAQFQADGSTSLTSTSNSVYVGYQTRGFSNSDSNSIVIGYQAIGKGANTTVLGNTSATQAWIYGTGIIYNSGGNNYSENLRLPESSLGWSVIHMGGAAATSGTGANQWTILKADSASSHRFEIRHNTTAVVSILTNGNVGIGTTSQTSKFQVNNNGATGSAFYVDIGNPSNATTLFEHTGANTPVPFRLTKSGAAGSGSYGLLDLFYDTNTAGHGSNLYFSLDDSAGNITEYGGIGARINANTNGSERGDLYFYTMNTGTGRAEQMVLRYDGNLGIGTTNPSYVLDITTNKTGDAAGGTIRLNRPNNISYENAINFATNGTNQWFLGSDNDSTEKLYLYTAQSTGGFVQTWQQNGNVGIGTTSPAAKLHVSQSTAGAIGLQVSMPTGAETTQAGIRVFGYSPAIELMDKDSVQNWYMGIDDNDSNKLLFGRGYGPGQGVTQAMTIDVSDNVGIGTTAPGNRLHVDGGANLPIRTVSSTFSGMECHITNGTWKAFIGTESGGGGNRYNSADNQHTFYNNSTAVMRINSSGYMGLGTTVPNKMLVVAANGGNPGFRMYKSPDGSLNASQLVAEFGTGSSSSNAGTSGGAEYGIVNVWHNGTERSRLYAYDVGVGNVTNFALDAFTFGTTTSFAQVGVVAKSASTPVIISRGFTSQTAPLMTYQDSSGNVLGYIAANGLDSSTFNGYTWTPNYAGGVNSPSTATYRKSSGNNNAWDGHVYSSEGFAKNVHVTFKASQTNAYLMVGLNSDPAGDANYSSLDYAWYPRNDGILEIYESNASIGTFGAYTTSTVLSVVYDGTNVTYLKDGTVMRTVARAVGNLLYLDSSFYTLNGAVNSVRYGPTNIDLGSFSARMVSTYNTATGLSTFSVPKTLIGNIHFANGSGTNTSTRYQAALTFMGSSASESQAGIYVTNDNSTGTHMGFATTDSYATGPQLGMTISNTGAISFPRAATINTPATCSIGSTGNNGGVLSLGASYFGLRITSLNGDIINGNVNTVNITPGAGGNTTGLNVTGNMGASGIVAGFTNVGSASSKVMVVKGQTSQSGNLQEWQNSSGTSLASVGPAGNFSVPNLTSTNAIVANSVASPRYYSYSVNAGNAVRLGQWFVNEGTVALHIQVSSDTGSNSGTSSYLYQGGFNVISNTSGQYAKLLPLMIGRGHGDGPDASVSSTDAGGWTVFLYTGTTNPAYTMGVAVGVPTGKANKALRVTVTELRGGMTYTADGSSIAYPTTSYPYTIQHSYGAISSAGAISASGIIYPNAGIYTSAPDNFISQTAINQQVSEYTRSFYRQLPDVVGDYVDFVEISDNQPARFAIDISVIQYPSWTLRSYDFTTTWNYVTNGVVPPSSTSNSNNSLGFDFELETISLNSYYRRFRIKRTRGTTTGVYAMIYFRMIGVYVTNNLTALSSTGTSGLSSYVTKSYNYSNPNIYAPPPAGYTGAGVNLTLSASSGVTSGAGGSIVLTPGNPAGTNSAGSIVFNTPSQSAGAQASSISYGVIKDYYFTRTMPITAGDYVEIGEMQDSWPTRVELTIMTYQHAAEGGSIKKYDFSPSQLYASSGLIQPIAANGANGWELEKYVPSITVVRLRIRRTVTIASSPACDVWIHLRIFGINNGFLSYSGTGTSSVGNTWLNSALASQNGINPGSPVGNNGAGRDFTVSAGSAAGTGAGGNLYLRATNGSTTGAGGSIILQTGAQATSGGDGQIIVRKSGTSDIGAIFPITNHSVGIQHGSGGTIGYVEIARQGFNGTNYLRLASHTTEGAFASGGSAIFSNQAISLVPGGSGASDSDVPVAIYRRPLLFTYSNFTTTNFGAGLKGSLSNGVIRVCDGTGTTVDSGNGGSFAYKSSTTNISTATNDLVLNGSAFQRLNCTTACNLTGVAPPTGGTHVDGRILRIVNTGTANLTLVHNSASSATANRFFNVAGANLVIAPNDYAELMYDATDNGRATSSPGWRVY